MKKTIFLGMLICILHLPALCHADECLEGDCDNGTGTGFTEEGKIYRGEWKDGLPHGVGKLTISKGKHLEGQWEKGQFVEDKKKKE